MFVTTLRVALTVIVMEQALMDQHSIVVSIGDVLTNTLGRFDFDCDELGFDGPTYDSCKHW